ncbi:hypothetical protein [Ruegeria sp. Ofav3-42]|uniref:hypothetical protein n=1 Tax=Ruegeria sp. Ofav3-42 TaxID=2917759 RepID=UPI001EF6539B|nr:hypothetical protein [Ruegeria sp. Ofav3-42]MCG7521382.1 hypothetical protein [Ruegeria sp. Ofav3-42]
MIKQQLGTLKSSEAEHGDNSRYTPNAVRVVGDSVDDIRALWPHLSNEQVEAIDFGTFSTNQFFDEMFRVTQNGTDPEFL